MRLQHITLESSICRHHTSLPTRPYKGIRESGIGQETSISCKQDGGIQIGIYDFRQSTCLEATGVGQSKPWTLRYILKLWCREEPIIIEESICLWHIRLDMVKRCNGAMKSENSQEAHQQFWNNETVAVNIFVRNTFVDVSSIFWYGCPVDVDVVLWKLRIIA